MKKTLLKKILLSFMALVMLAVPAFAGGFLLKPEAAELIKKDGSTAFLYWGSFYDS